MAVEECSATSAVTSSSPPTLLSHSWWDILHPAAAPANSLALWSASNTTTWQQQQHHQNPNSNSSNCDEEDGVSISTSLTTNASNHSGLSAESSGRHQLVDQPVPQSNNFVGEQVSDNHIWSHVLSVASHGDLRSGQDVGENLFEAISSKTTTTPGIFEPACDYLKKIDSNNWEFPNPSSVFNNFIKNLNGYTNDHDNHQSSIGSAERPTELSNLVSHWSIAPPNPDVSNLQVNPKTCDEHISLTPPSVENYSQQPAFCGMATVENSVLLSCYGHHADHHVVKMDAENVDMEAPTSYYRRAFKGSNYSNGYQHHHDSFINNSSMEADSFYGSSSHSSSTSTITNYSRLSKPLIDIHVANKPCFRPLNNSLSDCKKQGLQAATTSPQTRSNNGRTQGISGEGKKKRGEETSSNTVLKKPKQESSTASSVKAHAPKVKLGDRITALQQIVSPFGKTDTASVLLEAIGYINFLQEQVQLLSNPYMKPNSHKDPWESLDRKDQKGDSKVDLRSRGLCLVPISCTPQLYHETTGSDYWTPTYRGCLYG